ncbi:MAG: HAD hydrolase family protein, partial [Erysipelotrichaceae bacterium]|nr:HAD hydrolase family protein [Erysipelotrichaceae bacterium]
MAIIMIVIDLDGTLLKNDKTIDDLTREYLIRAQ